MRQIWISKSGPPEVLVIKESPDPHPAAGELRIRVEACGVNFADIMGRLGLYPDLPRIPVVPGYEVAGRVDPGELPDRLAADCRDGRIEGGRDGACSFRRRRRGDRCDPDRKAYRGER